MPSGRQQKFRQTPRRNLSRLLILLAMVSLPTQAEEIVFIVNPGNDTQTLTAEDINDIYLGKKKFFPTGLRANPADQTTGSESRKIVYKLFIRIDQDKLTRYWSKRIFSGKATPPQIIEGDTATIKWVARQKHALAYVFKKSITDNSVKILKLRP